MCSQVPAVLELWASKIRSLELDDHNASSSYSNRPYMKAIRERVMEKDVREKSDRDWTPQDAEGRVPGHTHMNTHAHTL